MKQLCVFFCTILVLFSFPQHVRAGQGTNTYFDYQNYNHGYCPACSCCPCRCSGPVPQPCGPAGCAPPCAPCNPPPCAPCGQGYNYNAPSGQAPCAPCGPAPCAAPVPCAPPCQPAPCRAPCKPGCGTDCGISIIAIGVAAAALITAGVLIVSSGNGKSN